MNPISSIDTGHEDMIHGAELDYYGLRLATCSSDNAVRVFSVKNGTHQLIDELKGHFGPVWQISWSHPKFGNLLASCSYDKKVIVWKEVNGKWGKHYEYANHDSSVNSVQFAPIEHGLMLACGSSDGCISILSYSVSTGAWESRKIQNAHAIGCNAVSWASPLPTRETAAAQPKRLASGGCDNLVKIWREVDERWMEEAKLEVHSDWVRDVAWAPCIGLDPYVIASCSQDRRVIIWSSNDALQWTSTVLNVFDDVVWNVSWSLTGRILAVSGGDNKITLWKQNLKREWQLVNDVKK